MIALGFAAVFAIYGGYLAKKRGGQRADIAQYAAAYAMGGLIIGVLISVMIARFA